tara:strand:- start:734 stop:1966 length:1233 start_codon:yes stop_codon:yes gene_type:complete
MKKYLYTIILCLNVLSVLNAQGLKLSSEIYLKVDSWEMDELGFLSNIPPMFSLREYCPSVKDQGNASSCVGWSTAYGAMTIIYNIKYDFSASIIKKTNLAFDPNFIYSIIYSNSENDCSEGTYPTDAMEALKNHGCKRMMIPQLTDCNTPINDTSLYFGKPFRIKEYFRPPSSYLNGSFDDKLEILKTSLSNKNPLLISVNTTRSINKASEINGLWDSFSDEDNNGGHAMCLIGYDDEKFGGAFEIMNSWGTKWGDQGFVWVKYNDFIRNVKQIYMIETYEIPFTTVNNLKCLIGDCLNKYSLIFYNKNSFYEGQFSNGKKDGFGLHHLVNGDEYMGKWQNNKKNGNFYYYNIEKNKFYLQLYENDKLTDEENLGFVQNKSLKDDFLLELFDSHQSKGHIEIGDNDELND